MKRIACILLIFLMIIPYAITADSYTLQKGSKGTSVVKLQKQLHSLKLFYGNTDGIYGVQTESSVKRAQRALAAAGYKVTETGIADPYTLECIYNEECKSALMTLRLGSSGTYVRELQNRLIELNVMDGSADGDYGQKTYQAVLDFQIRMNELGVEVAVDGIATPQLIELLNSDVSQYGFRSPLSSNSAALGPEEIYAPSCVLIDGPSGKILFSKNAEEKMYPASTTKIMTLIMAIEAGNLDRTITIPTSAADVPKDSSLVPVHPGDVMTMRDLLYGLIIRSGNDAANAVAELTSGSIDTFVDQMNQKALQLGLVNTHFMNPHGYHNDNHYTTAADLASLTRYGLTNADFCQIVTCLEYTLPTQQKSKVLKCTHEIFKENSKYYIPYAAGVKSGTTSQAGFCYVGAYQNDGKTMIAVVLGENGKYHGWRDIKKLFSYGLTQYESN